MASSSLLPYQKLISQARDLTDSYERLKERFSHFANHAAHLNKQGPVPGVVVEKDPNEPKFEAMYLRCPVTALLCGFVPGGLYI